MSRGKPLNKMIHLYGGQAGFDEARQGGDVWEKKLSNGRSLWFDYEEEDYADEGVDDTTTLTMGKRTLAVEDAGKMKAVAENK